MTDPRASSLFKDAVQSSMVIQQMVNKDHEGIGCCQI